MTGRRSISASSSILEESWDEAFFLREKSGFFTLPFEYLGRTPGLDAHGA